MRVRRRVSFFTTGEARRRVERIDLELGNWPYEPGAHGMVEAEGDWNKKPDPNKPVWDFSWDNSDDPYKGGWTGTLALGVPRMTRRDAIGFGIAKLKEVTERRLVQARGKAA